MTERRRADPPEGGGQEDGGKRGHGGHGGSAREIALEILHTVDERRAYAKFVLDGRLERHKPQDRDRKFITELVYGTLRWRGTADWLIGRAADRRPEDMDPWVRNVLRMAVYQILFLGSIPAWAACNEAALLARRYCRRGAQSFVNAVCRRIAREASEEDAFEFPPVESEPIAYIHAKYSFPAWLVERWLARLGLRETLALCEATNRVPEVSLRANTLRLEAGELALALSSQGLGARKSDLTPDGVRLKARVAPKKFKEFVSGLFTLQDDASILVGHCVAPRTGWTVLDLCSAPGTKTTHLAELMGNSGLVLAVDLHEHRLSLVEDNCRRLGIDIVTTLCCDMRQLPEGLSQADAVLLDAPCSGIGSLRRKPDLRWSREAGDIKTLAVLQRDMLRAAATRVRKGGCLVYSVCSTEPEEGREVIREFLAGGHEFRPAPLEKVLRPETVDYLDLQGGAGRDGLRAGTVELQPHTHDTDGFFIARLQRD